MLIPDYCQHVERLSPPPPTYKTIRNYLTIENLYTTYAPPYLKVDDLTRMFGRSCTTTKSFNHQTRPSCRIITAADGPFLRQFVAPSNQSRHRWIPRKSMDSVSVSTWRTGIRSSQAITGFCGRNMFLHAPVQTTDAARQRQTASYAKFGPV